MEETWRKLYSGREEWRKLMEREIWREEKVLMEGKMRKKSGSDIRLS